MYNSKKLAILGANDQQNPLILKASEMGFETHTFAWQTGGEIGERTSDYFYPISANNREGILAKCREIGIDAIVSIGSDIAAQTAAYVAEALGLPGNDSASVRCATNKISLRTILGLKGICQPKYVAVGDTLPLETLQSLTYPLVVKPSDRSGGRGLAYVANESDLFNAINNAREFSFERKAIVEEFINGTLYSCECISQNNNHTVLGFTQREVVLAGSRFCEYRHTVPAILPFSVETQIRTTVPKLLNALGLSCGASSIEFIVDSRNKPYIIEVTPTMYGDYIGTHLIPLSYGFDYTSAVIHVALGQEIKQLCSTPKAYSSVTFSHNPLTGVRGEAQISSKPIQEFGGCLKFRLEEYSPYFSESDKVLALNSEYTAFWCALQAIKPKRVFIPYYASSNWEKVAAELGIAYVYYHIDSSFLPTDIQEQDGDAVLLINYHGLCTAYIENAPFKHKIVDNSMAFFEKPSTAENTYTIYSARKFFAVPDGAYLTANLPITSTNVTEQDVSFNRTTALLQALELGPGKAYKAYQANEQQLAPARKSMSRLTKKLLCSIQYEKEKNERMQNFNILHSYLWQHNMISINNDGNFAPQFYPLLVSADIRSRLIEKKIYIPLMWRKTLSEEFSGLAEKTFSERLICLPIEPDYSVSDMEYLAKTVVALLT